jgi:hypothetical protein
VSPPTVNPSTRSITDDSPAKQDYPISVNIPPRGSSTDVGKRILNPSPLSKPVTMAADSSHEDSPPAGESKRQQSQQDAPVSNPSPIHSPAAQQLAAINQKGAKSKSKTSRLRRAFSFGSAAEFRKAAVPEQDTQASGKTDAARLHKEPSASEIYDAEQARIAKKQEEGGIGNSIYGGRLFSGSTDNLSISSTASSASIMIRKMGRGVKRSTRSLVGLFRPKSIVGAPDAEAGVPGVSEATVSMITVEADRDGVNVNTDLRAQNGGSGVSQTERNSVDASKTPSMVSERAGSSGTDNSGPRKSIIGGDKERLEALAAVRKGILKSKYPMPPLHLKEIERRH